MQQTQSPARLLPWKKYLHAIFESFLVFYIATFCMAVFFSHRGEAWLINGLFLIALYIFVIVVCTKRLFQKLPLAAIMLAIPIAPLLALFSIISLIPIIQYLL